MAVTDDVDGRALTVPGWTGTTWNGTFRMAKWAHLHLFMNSNGLPGTRTSDRALGQQRVLVLTHGTEIVSFGIGDDIESAIGHLHIENHLSVKPRVTRITFDEAIARWGGPLPTEDELDALRKEAQVTGVWPAHTPGPTCFACGHTREAP